MNDRLVELLLHFICAGPQPFFILKSPSHPGLWGNTEEMVIGPHPWGPTFRRLKRRPQRPTPSPQAPRDDI